MNLFIEGLQGSGKSTLLNKFAKQYPDYPVYREGDYNPVELAWNALLTYEQYQKMLTKYEYLKEDIIRHTVVEDDTHIVAYTLILAENRQFYQDMEQYELYNGRVSFSHFHEVIMKRYQMYGKGNGLFECSFFQNSIETMMLFYEMNDTAIYDFYQEAFSYMKDKNFQLIYLDSENIRNSILQIKKERVDEQGLECWFPLMMEYLKASPYGKRMGYQNLDDLIKHLARRRELELGIIQDIIKTQATILKAKQFKDDFALSVNGSNQ